MKKYCLLEFEIKEKKIHVLSPNFKSSYSPTFREDNVSSDKLANFCS